MGSPWSPAGESVPPSAQPLPPPPAGVGQDEAPGEGFAPPPGSPRRWGLIGLVAALLVAAIVASAVITYALSHGSDGQPAASTASPASPGPAPVSSPTSSQAEQAAAKDKLCHVFEVSVRGQEGQGGVVVNGGPNIPIILRTVNSVVAVQNTDTAAVPESLKAAVQKYVETSMDLTTAALGDTPIDELRRLTEVNNDATYALADECGVPR